MPRGDRTLVTSPVAADTWRWYAALLIANALDLLLTYAAVELGFEEWNPLLRPVLLTPWPAAMKLATCGFLAYALWKYLQRPQPRSWVLSVLKSATLAYLAVVVMHLIGLVTYTLV